MALNLYDKFALTLNSTTIGGTTAQSFGLDPQVRGEPTSGALYPSIMTMVGQAPRGSLSTLNIAAALAVVTQFGYAANGAGVKLYAYKHAADGTRAGASAHKSWTIGAGLVVPRRLGVSHGGDASLDLDIIARSTDGTTHPVVIGESVTMPSVTDAERFTLGPVTIGGVALDSVKSLELDFGLSVLVDAADGYLYPTFISVGQAAPRIVIRGVSPAWCKDSGAIAMLGQAATHVNTKLYFRKRAANATFVADVTAEHVKITTAGLAYVSSVFNAGAGPGETEITIAPIYDGTNNPLIITTASAIT